jgi:hypothetical protein
MFLLNHCISGQFPGDCFWFAVIWVMPPKLRRGGAAAARKAAATRRRVGKAQSTAEEAPLVEEVKEAPAEEAKAVEEAPMLEEPKRQPSPPPLQQPSVEEKSTSDAVANGFNHGEGTACLSCLCMCCVDFFLDLCCGLRELRS